MTERMIENRIKKLRELKAQQKELEAAAEAIRAELKADLEENQKLHRPLERDYFLPAGQQGAQGRASRCLRPVLRKRQSFRRLAQPRVKVENTIKSDKVPCTIG